MTAVAGGVVVQRLHPTRFTFTFRSDVEFFGARTCYCFYARGRTPRFYYNWRAVSFRRDPSFAGVKRKTRISNYDYVGGERVLRLLRYKIKPRNVYITVANLIGTPLNAILNNNNKT